MHPVSLPYSTSNPVPDKTAIYQTVSFPVPKEVDAFPLATTPAGMCAFLSAAFFAYLARLGEASSFDVGFISPGLRSDLKGLEGIFSLQLPLHVEVNFRSYFSNFFLQVRKQMEAVRQQRSYSRDVLARYPVLRSAGDQPRKVILPITVEWLEDFEEVPVSDFTFLISTKRAECHWVFNSQIHHTSNMTRMLGQFKVMLQDIIKNPDKCIAELSVLTDEECQRLLVEFNDTTLNYPENQCIHQLFDLQVERTPHAIAVVYGNQELTYQELNCRASQVAHRLRALGAGPETLIAICMDRSPELVVGILGQVWRCVSSAGSLVSGGS